MNANSFFQVTLTSNFRVWDFVWLERGKVLWDRLRIGPAELGIATTDRECFLGTLPVSVGVMFSDLEILSNSRSLQNQFFNLIGLGKVETTDTLKLPCKSSKAVLSI